MSIRVKEGRVNVDGKLKEVGSKLKMKEEEEKRLVALGFAEFIDEEAEKVEVVKDAK